MFCFCNVGGFNVCVYVKDKVKEGMCRGQILTLFLFAKNANVIITLHNIIYALDIRDKQKNIVGASYLA